ncbi:hypothetical protein TNCV_1459731 [Trichonephila clavipes]|nr:hypothetical protein TNCV_1459731 [Trichonephila clavipes]
MIFVPPLSIILTLYLKGTNSISEDGFTNDTSIEHQQFSDNYCFDDDVSPQPGSCHDNKNATAGSDVVQSGRPIFDDFFQHLWPYIGNNTANVVFQMVKHLLLIRIDQ